MRIIAHAKPPGTDLAGSVEILRSALRSVVLRAIRDDLGIRMWALMTIIRVVIREKEG